MFVGAVSRSGDDWQVNGERGGCDQDVYPGRPVLRDPRPPARKWAELMRIAIALSSGGAAGMAHVGVLQEWRDAGISIDGVAGTSAGATVGAAFAAGHLDGFSATMCGLTRSRAMRLFDPTWPRAGLLEGRRHIDLVRAFVGERIEDLPLPYAAISMDLLTGEEVVLRKGSVLEAIRASSAVPGLFTPSHLDGRVLVDGGLVNPLPVSVARSLGATFVIAVDVIRFGRNLISSAVQGEGKGTASQVLDSFLARYRRPPEDVAATPRTLGSALTQTENDIGLFEVLSKASGVIQARIAAGRLQADPPDFLLQVPVPDLGIFDLHRSSEMIGIGREAARAEIPRLRETLAGRRMSRLPAWLRTFGNDRR